MCRLVKLIKQFMRDGIQLSLAELIATIDLLE